jgi:hypothetical protein
MTSPWSQRLNIPVPRLLASIPIPILMNDWVSGCRGDETDENGMGSGVGSEVAGMMERMQYMRTARGIRLRSDHLPSGVGHLHEYLPFNHLKKTIIKLGDCHFINKPPKGWRPLNPNFKGPSVPHQLLSSSFIKLPSISLIMPKSKM